MNRTLIRRPQRLLLAVALAGLGTVAMAQSAAPATAPASTPTAAHQRMTPEQWHERMVQRQQEWHKHITERRAEHLAKLKTALAITPEQQAAWSQFETAMQPPAPPQPAGQPGDWAKLTTPERIDRMEQRMADRQQRFKQMGEAIKTFYAQLTPQQQKTFDERAMRFAEHLAGHERHGKFGWHDR